MGVHDLEFYKKHPDASCIRIDDNRSTVVLKDAREPRKYIAQNIRKKGIVVYQIDGGLLKDATQLKCDYALLTEDNHLYLVELKGSDYPHALEQIIHTIQVLEPEVNLLNARVVLSKVRVPGLRVTQEVKLQNLLSRYHGDLKKKAVELEEKI